MLRSRGSIRWYPLRLAHLRHLVVLLLGLALLAPASAFGRVLYACSMSGKVSSGRCCCHRAKAQPPQTEAVTRALSGVKVERPSCCQAEDHRGKALPASPLGEALSVLPAAPSTLLPIVSPLAVVSLLSLLEHRTARGPPGLPCYTENCSLLI